MWLATVLAAGALLAPDGVQFFDGTWESVLKEAKKTNKLVFVDFYTDW